MRFGQQFEFHKIPEWYDEYLDYENLKAILKKFQGDVEYKTLIKLPGYYTINNQQVLISLDFFEKDAGDEDDELP